MTSQINPYNIDGTFPVAGQDNSSQGFRDNFTNIKNNLLFAQKELTDLQSKVLVTSALTGQSLTNDMAGTRIYRPQLASWTQTLFELGIVTSLATLDFNEANFQKIITGAPITLEFGNWPTSIGTGALGYGLMRVWIVVTDVAHTVTVPASVNIGIEEVAGAVTNVDSTTTISFDAPGNYIFDFSSIDGGTSYLIFDVTRNHSTFRDSGFYFNDTVNSTVLIGFRDALPTALQLEAGQDSVSAYGSYNATQAANLSLNNINTFETSLKTPGYSVTSARGNLELGQLLPVESNDFLGYNQAYAYTGVDASGFQQMAAIGYYATGANVSGNGFGGNIGFFTRQDDDADNVVYQAMGIEHDQSVTFYGNVNVMGTLSATVAPAPWTRVEHFGNVSYGTLVNNDYANVTMSQTFAEYSSMYSDMFVKVQLLLNGVPHSTRPTATAIIPMAAVENGETYVLTGTQSYVTFNNINSGGIIVHTPNDGATSSVNVSIYFK
jgi:hypothetical protein